MKNYRIILFAFLLLILSVGCGESKENSPGDALVKRGEDQAAEFPDGMQAMQVFLRENIEYPEECYENSIQGKVYIEFVVNEGGKVVDSKVKRSIHPALDAEALRVVNLFPDWKPAYKNGVAVKSKFILPVNFKLEDTGKKKTPVPLSKKSTIIKK